jgi:hypothetical protein
MEVRLLRLGDDIASKVWPEVAATSLRSTCRYPLPPSMRIALLLSQPWCGSHLTGCEL